MRKIVTTPIREPAPILKPTCGPDDGSDAGPWIYVPARQIDGDHPYTRREP